MYKTFLMIVKNNFFLHLSQEYLIWQNHMITCNNHEWYWILNYFITMMSIFSCSILHVIRGNSLETPNIWGLSSFHPNVSKQPPPPQCLGFVLFSPRRFYRAELAATWKPRRCHVSTGQNKKSEVVGEEIRGDWSKQNGLNYLSEGERNTAGREDSGGERRREGAWRGSSKFFENDSLSLSISLSHDRSISLSRDLSISLSCFRSLSSHSLIFLLSSLIFFDLLSFFHLSYTHSCERVRGGRKEENPPLRCGHAKRRQRVFLSRAHACTHKGEGEISSPLLLLSLDFSHARSCMCEGRKWFPVSLSFSSFLLFHPSPFFTISLFFRFVCVRERNKEGRGKDTGRQGPLCPRLSCMYSLSSTRD